MRDPIVGLDFHVSPAPAKQELAASNKRQTKSKKGAHLSVRLLLTAVDFVPIPQGGTIIASLITTAE
jgi:hypothetical protein